MHGQNPLLTRWQAGEPTLGGWITLGGPPVAEHMAAAGFDTICVDQQHGLSDQLMVGEAFRAIELHGVAPITRVPTNDPMQIGRALDLGAQAVIIPMVNNSEEAIRAAAACRYPPRGVRSAGPVRGVRARVSDRLEDLDDVACVVMVETKEGLRNVDLIAATPCVDAIYIGPADLAVALGLPRRREERSPAEAVAHAAAVELIRAACVRRGVAPGIHTDDGDVAAIYLEQGFLMVTVASDMRLLGAGSRQQLAVARAAVMRSTTTATAS
jgi:4-hydroxy-2-oxoheptanedioate aldolase